MHCASRGTVCANFLNIMLMMIVLLCMMSTTWTEVEAHPKDFLRSTRCDREYKIGDKIMWPFEAVRSNQTIIIEHTAGNSTGNPSVRILSPEAIEVSGGSNLTVYVETEFARGDRSLGDGFVFGVSNGTLLGNDIFHLERTDLVSYASMNSESKYMHVGCGGSRVAGYEANATIMFSSPAPRGGMRVLIKIYHSNDLETPVRIVDDLVVRVKGCEVDGEPTCAEEAKEDEEEDKPVEDKTVESKSNSGLSTVVLTWIIIALVMVIGVALIFGFHRKKLCRLIRPKSSGMKVTEMESFA